MIATDSGFLPVMQVAIVRSAGLPEQAEWLADLQSIAEVTKGAGSLSPCVMIVGKVVNLAPV